MSSAKNYGWIEPTVEVLIGIICSVVANKKLKEMTETDSKSEAAWNTLKDERPEDTRKRLEGYKETLASLDTKSAVLEKLYASKKIKRKTYKRLKEDIRKYREQVSNDLALVQLIAYELDFCKA